MRSLNNYGIITNAGEVISIEADVVYTDGSFVIFSTEQKNSVGVHEMAVVAIYSASSIFSVTKQNDYTEEEILSQIAVLK